MRNVEIFGAQIIKLPARIREVFCIRGVIYEFAYCFFRHSSGRPPLAYNRLDHEYHVNRASHTGPYRVVDGLPL